MTGIRVKIGLPPLPAGRFLPLLLLVVPCHKLIEEPDAEGGGALGYCRRVLARPRHPGDIEVRPRDIGDEALDELCAEDASGVTTAADILHVGRVTVDIAVVALIERQPPDFLSDGVP